MKGRNLLVMAAMAAAAGTSTSAAPAARKPAAAPKPDTALMQNCDAHKFETVVETTVDGQPHKSRVKLCGKDGQSDADWIGTLKDAIAKLDANKELDPAVRTQIVSAINTEIARLQTPGAAAAPALPLPLARRPAEDPATALARDYGGLPPLPSAAPPPPHVLGSAMAGGPVAPTREHRRSLTLAPVQLMPTGPAAKLSFTCFSPGDVGDDGPCTGFDRDTVLTIRANETFAAGASLLFLRNGEQRASVDLPPLQRGRSQKIALPHQLCAGLVDGALDLEVTRAGALVKAEGPFSLRC